MQREIYSTIAAIVVVANLYVSTRAFFDRAFENSISGGLLLSIATSAIAAFCLGRLALVRRQVEIGRQR